MNTAVVVVKWPLPEENEMIPSDMSTARPDATGNFQIGGLAPGEYRAIAVSMEIVMLDPGFDVLRRALAASPKIELGPSAVQSLVLEVSEIR